jgi:transposase-like protein
MTIVLPARHRRTHPIEFKTDLVAMCRQPGVSVSAVALAHGVNSNLLRRWMKQFPVDAKHPVAPIPANLVPIQIETANTSPSDWDIRYGVKSEAMSAEQRQMFDEDVVQDIAAVESELKLPSTPASPRNRAGRQTLPEHLERVEVRHEPESCTCPACQSNLAKIDEDVSEQLDVEPARFFVIRHIRPQYACRQCETITAAPVAPAVIDGSLAAPGLLAWVP